MQHQNAVKKRCVPGSGQPNVAAAYSPGFTSAMIVAWGGIGGILASTLFMDSEAKVGYPTGEFTWLSLARVSLPMAVR